MSTNETGARAKKKIQKSFKNFQKINWRVHCISVNFK